MSAAAHIKRQAFTTSRLLEFFSEKELALQIGVTAEKWPLALAKELIDNALDACESAGIAPAIAIVVSDERLIVADNGPGLPDELLTRSLDYGVRVSSNAAYVSPSRGQLGNALKCLWAAGFAYNVARAIAAPSKVEVEVHGVKHTIEVRLDRIKQMPDVAHARSPSLVKKGTRITLGWEKLSSLLSWDGSDFYHLESLVDRYCAANPHAQFRLLTPNEEPLELGTPLPARKWTCADPTNTTWYGYDQFNDLIARHVARGDRTLIRDFIAQFDGLRGTAKRKDIIEKASLERMRLSDLVKTDGELDSEATRRLLEVMREHSRAVKPAQLGKIGADHLAYWMSDRGLREGSFRYKAVPYWGENDAMPYMIEVAFGVKKNGTRELVGCVNFSAQLGNPFHVLDHKLGELSIDPYDPVVLFIHMTTPAAYFADRGKSRVHLEPDVENAIVEGIAKTSAEWKKAKRQRDREGRAKERAIEEAYRKRNRGISIKEAAFRVMRDAYMIASAGNTLPANGRQIMYPARGPILELTGKEKLDSHYFTQQLVPEFMEENPELTADWDVVCDARGHLHEPHTGVSIGLGTLEVRGYVQGWHAPYVAPPNASITLSLAAVSTSGPAGRYRFALFIEKEGFMPLLEHARIAERYDMAIFSTKGMSTTAARQLVEALTEAGVTILVLHDFDKAGITILHTLHNDTTRYQFKVKPKLIDLGLRLGAIEQMHLASEPVTYQSQVDPRVLLMEQGASEDEANFLVSGGHPGSWRGQRVELNAMTADVFLQWLARKFKDHGVGKVIPDRELVASAYRRAVALKRAQKALDEAMRLAGPIGAPPDDFYDRLLSELDGERAWDEVLPTLVD